MNIYYTNYDGMQGDDGTILKIVGEESDTPGAMPAKDESRIRCNISDFTSSVDFEEYQYEDTGTACKCVRSITCVSMADTKIKRISNEAFLGCFSLSYVAFPDTLEEIGDEAFAYCFALGGDGRRLRLPKTLKRIGQGTFTNCFALYEITVPKDCVVEGEKDGYLQIGELRTDKLSNNLILPNPVYIKVNRY